MEDQPILEDPCSEFITLSYTDQTLASHPEQLPNECTSMILDSDNCQNINNMVPLNDLLMGQTFIIETNEQPLFVNGTQLITFQHIDANGHIDDIQAISTTDSEKSMIQNINFTIDSNNQFQDIYTNFNKTTNVGDNLKEHLEIISNTDIDPIIGNYSNSTAFKILDDVAISPTDTNGHFVCDLCLCEFYKWQNYKKHKLEHLNDKPFKCLKCFKSFNYNNNYMLHIASHFTNNLKCPECKKEFKRIASFKSHLKIHKTEESITCNICNKIFNNQYRLDIHKEHCMQENILNPDNPTELTSINNFKTCKTCKMSISTISEYKMHIKEHRKFDSVLKKQYKCSVKLKKVHKTSNLVKRFKCDLCDWSFNKSNLLNRHMRTHTGEKPFKCSYCSRYFTQQNSLNRHMLKHKGLRPFKCEFCEMNFSQKGHLINHMKRCHAVTKESTRIHKCSMCSCVYNSINALNKHLNTYHGLKTKKLNKNIQKHVPTNVETEDINESISLIKDSSKLEKWLEEVANELQSTDDNAQSKHCNDPVSTQCEFGLNLIENEQFNHIDNAFSQISNARTSDHTDIESLTYSIQNDENHTVLKTKEPSSTEYDNVIKIKEKELVTTTDVNETIDKNKITHKQCSSRKKKSGNKISKSDTKTISPRKTNARSLNLKNISINQQSVRNKNQINYEAEPKVVYLPNITTNVDDNINVNIIQKPQPKVCQFCGKIFKKNADLERHERTHTGDKPYKCDKLDCNKAFATKCSLEYHAVTHLGKMKRAVCPQCSGLFATTSSMKVHMRQHTGEKPFKCPVCGDAFRTTGHLSTHVIIHERKKKRK